MEKLKLNKGVVILWKALFIVSVARATIDPKWETVFKSRSNLDWQAVWHEERHQRCFRELVSHMDWACAKDVYKIRRMKRSKTLVDRALGDEKSFLSETLAHSLLKYDKPNGNHQITKRGIMDECCHSSVGCSWEEYAEYCPIHKRIRN
ncbi:probable insulin-like peptide 7 [Limulus polyphemus]|uniref:Probable insulin-like peptide 7 n=1 Tax=Limulus polyphemus TaxID=6850 RepID=A0ABM1SH22_LIMPO|nr:probable insulin-like peptide 7 [Limulus polyphemus]XP_022242928.1 probable insulin-like peptide 7 [Limulus polyphemus]XP_022242929.1 probable insulin-like peptide 7 [Limulus polyphemus]